MAVFEYKALAATGKRVKGVIDADTPVQARRKLRDQQLFPTEVVAHTGAPGGADDRVEARLPIGQVRTRDVALMTRQLAVLLKAGMPMAEALSAVLDQTERPKLRAAIFDVRDRVNEGSRLADALRQHPTIFSSLYVNMVGAGEASGSLEVVLRRLVDVLEHQARMRSRVLSTLAYPAFMVIFAIGIIAFLMLVIVPRITALFEKQGQELPWITQALISVADFVGAYWFLILAAVLGVFALWRWWVGRPEGRVAWDRLKLRVPLYGALHLKLVSARFARILGTMLESGLTMMNALDVVNTVLQNKYVEQMMETVRNGVRRGRDLAVPLRETELFPPMLVYMIDLGQRSGELEAMLINAADTFDEDVTMTVDALVSLLEPVIIVVMGLFVGLLVLAILLPILNMSTGMRGG